MAGIDPLQALKNEQSGREFRSDVVANNIQLAAAQLAIMSANGLAGPSALRDRLELRTMETGEIPGIPDVLSERERELLPAAQAVAGLLFDAALIYVNEQKQRPANG